MAEVKRQLAEEEHNCVSLSQGGGLDSSTGGFIIAAMEIEEAQCVFYSFIFARRTDLVLACQGWHYGLKPQRENKRQLRRHPCEQSARPF